MLFSPQIPLKLEPRRPTRFEDFVAGPNSAVLDALKSLLVEPGVSLLMHGPESSGKTHLLNGRAPAPGQIDFEWKSFEGVCCISATNAMGHHSASTGAPHQLPRLRRDFRSRQ